MSQFKSPPAAELNYIATCDFFFFWDRVTVKAGSHEVHVGQWLWVTTSLSHTNVSHTDRRQTIETKASKPIKVTIVETVLQPLHHTDTQRTSLNAGSRFSSQFSASILWGLLTDFLSIQPFTPAFSIYYKQNMADGSRTVVHPRQSPARLFWKPEMEAITESEKFVQIQNNCV